MRPTQRRAGAESESIPWVDRAFPVAVQLQQAGEHDQARQLYIKILEQQPDHSDSLYFLASIAAQSGDLTLAADLLGQAIATARKAPYFVLLGNVLQKAGQLDLSAQCHLQAIALDPRSADAYYNLGNTLDRQSRKQDAVSAFEHAVAVDPSHVEALNNLALQYRSAGRDAEAIRLLESAVRLRPQTMALHLNLGNARMACGDHQSALASFDRAVALAPDFAFAHNNRGNALRNLGRFEDALAAYESAAVLAPRVAEIYVNKGNALLGAGRITDSLASFRHALALDGCSPVAHSSALFAFHYDSSIPPQELARMHQDWGRRFGTAAPGAHANQRDPERRLRIGYVSGDFRQHPVAIFTAHVLEAHDRSAVEVFAYSNNAIDDHWTARIRTHSDHWTQVAGWSDQELAARIESDRIDILIDLAGHTAGNRLLTFARKPAPVQATWLGYFNTTGLPAIDYILVDPVIAGSTATTFTEQVYPLDGCYLCYQVPADPKPQTATPAAARGYITYGCFNALAKITGNVVEVWSRILGSDPLARLILRNAGLSDPAARARCHESFAKAGVDPARVGLFGECSHSELLAFYSQVDIALDPFPYNGGTTTCEALSMGVPVVTLAGNQFVSRVGASILTAAGHPEWIAADVDEYCRIALSLRDQVFELRPGLAAAIAASPLADAPAFARKLESAYRRMWHRWCNAV